MGAGLADPGEVDGDMDAMELEKLVIQLEGWGAMEEGIPNVECLLLAVLEVEGTEAGSGGRRDEVEVVRECPSTLGLRGEERGTYLKDDVFRAVERVGEGGSLDDPAPGDDVAETVSAEDDDGP